MEHEGDGDITCHWRVRYSTKSLILLSFYLLFLLFLEFFTPEQADDFSMKSL